MNFHILTLFPEMITDTLSASIIGRASQNNSISIDTVNIRDYTNDKHGSVDDYPYGGGAGMLMQAQPIYDAYKSIEERIGHKPRIVYLSPQGKTFDQKIAHELSLEEDLVLLCGHYEGVDERVLDKINAELISIGDYVLTGGELAAMVIVDSVSRLVPGVLHNDESSEDESFENNLLEYPQYSRPYEWEGMKVPDILLSGDHKKVDEWRHEKSLERTFENRPDLLERADLSKKDIEFIDSIRYKYDS
ncbi:MAG: tRNA (guanosine(37)-N1)-methyltransferase TrmD [Lachnospiraceae bacterium]|nr:tRNA (guanosine(37)-N1)-methyltransferase TrmD [Lachnospiraceae bacterium]